MKIGGWRVNSGKNRLTLESMECMIKEVDKMFPDKPKELYSCTKSWINIRLYEKMGFKAFREVTEKGGVSFVYMRKV